MKQRISVGAVAASLAFLAAACGGGGGAHGSPAAVSVDRALVRGPSGLAARAGRPIPILLDRPARLMFQGDQSRGAFPPYAGQMHSHTIFSDGIGGDPGTAYDMARYD